MLSTVWYCHQIATSCGGTMIKTDGPTRHTCCLRLHRNTHGLLPFPHVPTGASPAGTNPDIGNLRINRRIRFFRPGSRVPIQVFVVSSASVVGPLQTG